MKNGNLGEALFTIDGKPYKLRYSVDALCRLEDAAGKGIVAITQEFANPMEMRINTARAALWAGLQEEYPDMTLAQAGELIPKAGGLMALAPAIVSALALSFPTPDKGPEVSKRPQ